MQSNGAQELGKIGVGKGSRLQCWPVERGAVPFPCFDLAVCSLLDDLICLSVQKAHLIIIAIRAPRIELRVRHVLVKGKFGERHWGTGHVCNPVEGSCECNKMREITKTLAISFLRRLSVHENNADFLARENQDKVH
jgi:hypothetical protein